jgi:hypothetical protein
VPLLRATDQVVLGLLPTSARRAARLVTAITSDSGALRGYSLFQTLTPTNFLLKRSAGLAAPGFRKLERKIGNFPAFKYLAPTFFAAGTSRASVVDQVSVKLLPGVTPEQVFGSEYSGWELVGGRYEAKLARGGALEALKAAAVLHDNPLIKDVDPLFAFDVVPS